MGKVIRFAGILAGVVIASAWTSAFAQTGDCFNQLPGCLDGSFGVNGKVTAPSGMKVNDVAIQIVGGEERIVAVGMMSATKRTPASWVVVRYLPNGNLDPAFGSGGIVKMTPKSGFYEAGAVVVQPDNKLVVVGYGYYSSKQDLPIVARYNENGSPDSTFGSGGRVFVLCVANSKISGAAAAVTLQAGGKILITGQFGWIANRRLFVCRLNANGLLDTTFNGTGQYMLSNAIGDGSGIATQWIGQEEHIVVAGSLVYGPYYSTYSKAAVLRFRSSGQLDTSFNGSGIVLNDLEPGNNYAAAVAVDSSNRLIALISGGLACFDVSGTLDPTFGASGIAVSQHGGFGPDFAIQADQKILVSGRFEESYLAVQRFDANGVADLSFGFNGWVTTDFEAYYPGGKIAVQSDGKFVVAASVEGNPAVARFWYLPPQ